MGNKLSVKILDAVSADKLVSDFDITDYEVRDSNEVAAVLVLLMKEQERLTDELTIKGRESGYDDLSAKVDNLKKIIKSLANILGKRTDETNLEDKTLVRLTKDDVVEVVDNGESRYETNEVEDSTLMLIPDVSYTALSVEEYNDATDSHKSEEEFLYDLLCKFTELSLDNCISYSKKYLSDIDAGVVSEIIEKNYSWHTLVGNFTINKSKLNSSLKIYPEKRNELIGLNYVKRDIAVKPKEPTSTQLSLFPEDNEFESINVTPEGENNDEQ